MLNNNNAKFSHSTECVSYASAIVTCRLHLCGGYILYQQKSWLQPHCYVTDIGMHWLNYYSLFLALTIEIHADNILLWHSYALFIFWDSFNALIVVMWKHAEM